MTILLQTCDLFCVLGVFLVPVIVYYKIIILIVEKP